MVHVQLAGDEHVEGIIRVCRAGYRDVSEGILSEETIKKNCEAYYNRVRIATEVNAPTSRWGGYFVALDGEAVVGAAGGGMIDDKTSRLYVIYLDPSRRNEGIGSKLLDAVTLQQQQFGAKDQVVTVQRDNQKGIPFYEARRFRYEKEFRGKNLHDEPNNIVWQYRRKLS
ncbi:GNAT family N-acetyltransferase [Geomicrobium sp. JCM 19039]|uniref:GNAT family N-acetyltransferase n=1 Tax=Geomicrobium sp. JCM 19039 TaxID=1460636 RepID=UPI00045F154E|nr:GNAT family N-acetyltransferase [Geomicrobium sp. JCM 19039]GAK14677.1 hypothetical protein JCM19039_4617 [Geomicrobium sp. JCM 19039]